MSSWGWKWCLNWNVLALVFAGLIFSALLSIFAYVTINDLLDPFYATLAFFYPCYFVWLLSATCFLFVEFKRSGLGKSKSIKSALKFTFTMAISVFIVADIITKFFNLESSALRIAVRSLFLPLVREMAVHFVSESVFDLTIPDPASRALWLLPVYLLFIVSGHAMQLAASSFTEAIMMEVPSVTFEVLETFKFLSGDTPSMVWIRT